MITFKTFLSLMEAEQPPKMPPETKQMPPMGGKPDLNNPSNDIPPMDGMPPMDGLDIGGPPMGGPPMGGGLSMGGAPMGGGLSMGGAPMGGGASLGGPPMGGAPGGELGQTPKSVVDVESNVWDFLKNIQNKKSSKNDD